MSQTSFPLLVEYSPSFDCKEHLPERSQLGHFQQVNFSSKERHQKLKNFPSQIFLTNLYLNKIPQKDIHEKTGKLIILETVSGIGLSM